MPLCVMNAVLVCLVQKLYIANSLSAKSKVQNHYEPANSNLTICLWAIGNRRKGGFVVFDSLAAGL